MDGNNGIIVLVCMYVYIMYMCVVEKNVDVYACLLRYYCEIASCVDQELDNCREYLTAPLLPLYPFTPTFTGAPPSLSARLFST